MRRWYSTGRRLQRPRLGILRQPGKAPVVGRATLWSDKMSTHYRRLLGPIYLRGLMRWRRCALALHRAGIPVHSGTIPVERHWHKNTSFWPPQTRNVAEPTFRLLSSMCFLRFNWCHFNKPWGPTWTRGDVLLQQQSDEMIGMLEAVLEHGGTRIEQELAEAHRAAAPPMPPPRKNAGSPAVQPLRFWASHLTTRNPWREAAREAANSSEHLRREAARLRGLKLRDLADICGAELRSIQTRDV